MEDASESVAQSGRVAEAVSLRDFLQKQPSIFQICGAMAELGAEREMAVAFSKSFAEKFRKTADGETAGRRRRLQIRRDGRCPNQFQGGTKTLQIDADVRRILLNASHFRQMFEDVEKQSVEIQPALWQPVGRTSAIDTRHAFRPFADEIAFSVGLRTISFVRRG